MTQIDTFSTTLINIKEHDFTLKYNNFFAVLFNEKNTIEQFILDKINLILSNNKYNTLPKIMSIIQDNLIKINDTIDSIDADYMSIFEDNSITKFKLNRTVLLDIFNKNIISKNSKALGNIPKQLLLNEKQLFNMIMSEIERVNNNTNHDHYIVCNNNDILNLSIRLRYRSGNLACVMKDFNSTYNYDYFELNLTLGRLYPFLPPKVKYIRPNVNINLVHSILSMDIWNANWNYMIPLNTLIEELANKLEPYFLNSIDISSPLNNLTCDPYNSIESKILELCTDISTGSSEKINLDIKNCMVESKQSSNKYWSSGTGFGSGDKTKTWDISMYIDKQNISMNESIDKLEEIYQSIYSTPALNAHVLLENYIVNKFQGINILDFNKSYTFYNKLIDMIMLLKTKQYTLDFIKKLVPTITDLYDEIYSIVNMDLTNVKENSDIDTFINVYIYFIEMFQSIKQIPLEVAKLIEIVISEDIKSQYTSILAKEQFGQFDSTNNFLFNKYKGSLDRKSMLRIVSEISSLKKNLPINWDSSVAMRVSKTNANFISFVITGPKDTPYHNGVFEFHAYFPDGYPSVVPKVLINTTNGGKVRFNPNLYSCGKVCLSLLGTWSGEAGESWNPELSTFLQVIISIQSLILVDKPYFNEPGYERNINTTKGNDDSIKYNETIRLETIRVAMIGQIKNSIASYENFIIEHFKFKKDEIISTVSKWVEDSLYNKALMESAFEELKTLL